MYTYPLYAMVTRPKSTLLGQCGAAPGYVSEEEGTALDHMSGLRQEIRATQATAQHLTGLLSSQGAMHQALTALARLKEQHHVWRERFLLANRQKHEALGHLKSAP